MSELDNLLKKTTSQNKPLWEQLLEHIDEIDQLKENGKTYKQIAEKFGVGDPARFSRALKKARAEAEATGDEENENEQVRQVSFTPDFPAPLAEVEEVVEYQPEEIESTKVQNQINPETLDKLEELVSELKSLKKEVTEVAGNEAASAISSEIMKLNLSGENAKKETEKYSNDAKKYIDKMVAQAMTTIVKKSALTIEKKLKQATTDIDRRKNKYKPDRWLVLAVIGCLILAGGSYYAGIINNQYMSDYRVAKSNEAKWAEFVAKWKKATDQEKKTIEKMMSR